MKAVMMALGAVALLGGCATSNQDMAGPPPLADPMSPLSAPGYMAMASSSDLFEIESSRMALERSRNPQVRGYAQMMIDHHSRTSGELMGIARSAGLTPPPPQMLPPQMAAFDRVRGAGPGEFDSVYKREQIAGHQEALNLHRGYADGGDLPPFRAFAARTAPIVQDHYARAQSLPDYAPPPPPPVRRAGERG